MVEKVLIKRWLKAKLQIANIELGKKDKENTQQIIDVIKDIVAERKWIHKSREEIIYEIITLELQLIKELIAKNDLLSANIYIDGLKEFIDTYF